MLDFTKLIASYFVVFIHYGLYGSLGKAVDAIGRFAVPLFFISAGFFCYGNDLQKIKTKIFKILRMFLFTAVIYFLCKTAMGILSDGFDLTVKTLAETYTVKSVVFFLVFNRTMTVEFLWFLPALLYTYIVQYFVYKWDISSKWVFLFSLFALFSQILFGEFFPAFGIQFQPYLIRNFFLLGYPLFGMGMFLKKHQERITAISMKKLAVIFGLGLLETLLSRFLIGKSECYIGSLLIVFAVFTFAVQRPRALFLEKIVPVLDCSTGIYIFHVLAASVFMKAMGILGVHTDQGLLQNINGPGICVLTTVGVLILNWLWQKIMTMGRTKHDLTMHQ